MIISCKNCNKKFEIQDDLIGRGGRLVQCGSCSHQWKQYPATLKEEDKIIFLKEAKKTDISEDLKIENDNELTKKKGNKIGFLNLLLVFIISIIALIILLDTFKNPINDFFPKIDFYLNSFYETIKDIFLFLKDLIK